MPRSIHNYPSPDEPRDEFDPYNNDHDGPVYATQGGGYATENGTGQIVWLADVPDFVEAKVGDPIPEEWGVTFISNFTQEDRVLAEQIASEIYEA